MESETQAGTPVRPGASQVERLLADLNPPQREAVTHGEGPLLVLAGAGSGKTRVLTYRIAYLLATGQALPREILSITFTNKAAGEMRERVEQLVGGVSRLMWVMTFHSACARILRADAPRLGYKRAFTIYDEADSLRMVKRCQEELELDPKRFPPRAIRAQISAAKSQLVERDFADTSVVRLEENYRSTQAVLDAANAIVANNKDRLGKRLWTGLGRGEPVTIVELDDEHTEARYVASEVERLVADEGVPRDEIAVFYRVNAQSRVLEDTLVRFEIPYQVIGGTKFYDRAEIKDAIAYLSLIVNPADSVSFARIVNSPRRGIGERTRGRVRPHANTIGATVWEAFAEPERVPGLGAAAVRSLRRFADVMESLRARAERDETVT